MDASRDILHLRLDRFDAKVREAMHLRTVGELCELRAEDAEDGQAKITGYASVFNSPSVDLGGFTEVIAPGAFKKSLKRGDEVVALIEHQGGLATLGRRSASTLELKEDSKGLRTTIIPPNTTAGRDAVELVRRGDLSKMSFAFIPQVEEWDNDLSVRTIKEADIFDVSLVAQPAYANTSAGLRSRRAREQRRAEGSARVLEKLKRHKIAVCKAALLGVSS
jgi:HK97 family phage prohead protease